MPLALNCSGSWTRLSLPSEIVYSIIQEISKKFPVDFINLDYALYHILFATSLH